MHRLREVLQTSSAPAEAPALRVRSRAPVPLSALPLQGQTQDHNASSYGFETFKICLKVVRLFDFCQGFGYSGFPPVHCHLLNPLNK